LVREDYDVLYVLEMMPRISDDVILKTSKDEKRILLTLDKDLASWSSVYTRNIRSYFLQTRRFIGGREV
jgi:predicted nuclease of predicted toxin-antitoxin system